MSIGLDTMSPEMEGAKNYYRWILRQFRGSLAPRVLEIGSGRGALSEFILKEHPDAILSDIDPGVVTYLRSRFPDRTGQILCGDICDDAFRDALRAAGVGSVVLVNILEHVQDDGAFLRRIFGILPAGGTVCILVPAHAALYGSLDRLAGHHRRYSKCDLVERVTASGFTVDRAHYMNAVGGIGWFFNKAKTYTDFGSGGLSFQIRVFDRWIVPIVERLERIVHPPFGQSVVLVAHA